MEVAEVWRDVFFMIRGLRVVLETLRELLGNRSGRADVFHLGDPEESSCPDSGLLQAVHLGSWLPGRETARVLVQLRLPCQHLLRRLGRGQSSRCLSVRCPPSLCSIPPCLTADAAAQEASGHFDRSGVEVDLRIVLVQPGESEYHALLAEAGDHKQNMFRMLVVGHDHVDDFTDAPGLVKRSVHVVNWDRLG